MWPPQDPSVTEVPATTHACATAFARALSAHATSLQLAEASPLPPPVAEPARQAAGEGAPCGAAPEGRSPKKHRAADWGVPRSDVRDSRDAWALLARCLDEYGPCVGAVALRSVCAEAILWESPDAALPPWLCRADGVSDAGPLRAALAGVLAKHGRLVDAAELLVASLEGSAAERLHACEYWQDWPLVHAVR